MTLSINERVVAEARQVAAQRGTTLNQLIRDYLAALTRPGQSEALVAQLDALWTSSSHRSAKPWVREDLHERA